MRKAFVLLLLILLVSRGSTNIDCDTGIVYVNMHDCQIDCINGEHQFGSSILCVCSRLAFEQVVCANRIETTKDEASNLLS